MSKIEEIEKFIEDVYNLRKKSIADEGEYGIGNLVFKELRNRGYLDNLKKLKHEEEDKEYSLFNDDEENIDEAITFNTRPSNDPNAIEKLFEDDDWIIYKPTSEDGFRYLAKGSAWLASWKQRSENGRSAIDMEAEEMPEDEYYGRWSSLPQFSLDSYANYIVFESKKKKGLKYIVDNRSGYAHARTGGYLSFNQFKNKLTPGVIKYIADNGLCGRLASRYKKEVDSRAVLDSGVFHYPSDHGKVAWNSRQLITEVVIEEGCTRIKSNAFSNFAISNITIPNTVKQIGSRAFSQCKNLKRINIPDSVKKVGDSAFAGSGLEEITLTNIEYKYYCFGHCTNLKKINFAGVTVIPDSCFSGCIKLTELEIPDSVTEIGAFAFDGCPELAKVFIPKSVKKIGHYAFYDDLDTGTSESRLNIYIENESIPRDWGTTRTHYDGEETFIPFYGKSPSSTVYNRSTGTFQQRSFTNDRINIITGATREQYREDTHKFIEESLNEELDVSKFNTISKLKSLANSVNKEGTYSFEDGKLKMQQLRHGYQVSFFRPEITDGEILKVLQAIGAKLGETYLGLYKGSPEISYCIDDKETAFRFALIFNQESLWNNARGNNGYVENPNFKSDAKVNYTDAISKLLNILK